MSLTDAQREHLEHRLHEERARAVRALNRSIDDQTSATEQARAGDTPVATAPGRRQAR